MDRPASPMHLAWLSACLGVLLLALPSPAAEPVRFKHDVMAVLSRAGCNMGACHGNLNGKNGFKLSLRGEDPDFDLASLTRDMLGRRTNPQQPEQSLLLLKATATVPHEGGRRFGIDSPEYAILRGWIAGGLRADVNDTPTLVRLEVTPMEKVILPPADRLPLQVRATFSDGTHRDVTRLAVYEPSNPAIHVTPAGIVTKQSDGETSVLVRYLEKQQTVRVAFVPERKDFVWTEPAEANYIDHHVFAKLKALRIQPSESCTDTVFLRRAYLDALGLLPTPEETRAFLADSRSDKRARLIDQLVQRPEFADFWALKWSDLLRNEEKSLDQKGVQAFHEWMRQWFMANKPLDAFAREIIAARGSTYAHPPANYYRALRDPTSRAEATAQVFLGIRLQCARCHNHPFDRWTQQDYYNQAAFFARIDYRIVENQRRDRLDSHEFVGEQIVWPNRSGEVKHPRTGTKVIPRFLDSNSTADLSEEDRLGKLAEWVTSPENPFFARAQVNRIWFHLLGRGIVDPIDDFRSSNPPVNPALLDALAQDFSAHGFDLRHTVRTIMNSRTYQLSALTNDTNREDETNFSHALIRPLQAEQLLDALSSVTGVPVKFNGYPLGMRAVQVPCIRTPGRGREGGSNEGEQFLRRFGKPERLLTCECERADGTTLAQAFQLLTGTLINRMVAETDNSLGRFQTAGKSPRDIVAELYLAAFSRPATVAELDAAERLVNRGGDTRAALEDLLWGLLNAKEFLLRQ